MFIYRLFDDALQKDYIASNEGVISESERTWKEEVVV
jgi:hypothetical protein